MTTKFRVLRQLFRYNMGREAVASALCMTAHTLARKLKAEGTSYMALLYAVRLRMLDNLTKQGKSMDCILIELGYERRHSITHLLERQLGMTYRQYQDDGLSFIN